MDQDANQSLIECPFCAEKILSKAKKCKHCGETIDVALRKAEEALRATNKPTQVFMNAGGGASSAAAAAAAATTASAPRLRAYGHGIHIILSIITVGFWVPFWIFFYLIRNKSVYY